MVQDDDWFECSDGTRLFLRRWRPAGPAPPAAALLIAHGMAEHSGRYGRLAERLCAEGFEAWAPDMRGHGKTASEGGNDPGRGGLLGHCSDSGSLAAAARDLREIAAEMRKSLPGAGIFLLGHSWGSFAAQRCISGGWEGGDGLDGCALSGTRGPGSLKARAAAPLLSALAALRGRRKGSPLARALTDGPFAKAFRPARTPFDWLSRDSAEVDAYCADPLCGFLCSAGFYRDLAAGLAEIHRPEAMARIRKTLPVYIFCGSADPAGDMGSSPTALVKAYSSLGIADLEFALYPGARHEPLNETNRGEVASNLIDWMRRRLPARSGQAPGGADEAAGAEETDETICSAEAGGADGPGGAAPRGWDGSPETDRRVAKGGPER